MKKIHADHPMRIKSGKGRGKMPHEIDDDFFADYLTKNKMNETSYWVNVGYGEQYCLCVEKYGKPKSTRQLTPDQRGWARLRYLANYIDKNARWWIDPNKPSVPIPCY